MDLSVRAATAELMDDPGLPEHVYRRCLNNLAQINRITFTHRATLRWLDAVTRQIAPGGAVAILDVAFGQGDLLRAIAAWARRRHLRATLTGIDLNPRGAIAARAAAGRATAGRAATPPGQNITYLTGDVFAYTPSPKPDFIVTSQFTHHLDDDGVVHLLHWLESNALRGWHIADLRRGAFAYYGFPLLARIMFWHRIVRHDGAVSIARGFTRSEWNALLHRAGVTATVSGGGFRHAIARLK